MADDNSSDGPALEERVERLEERVKGVETEMSNFGKVLEIIRADVQDIKENHLSGLPSMARDITWIQRLLFLILAAIIAGAIAVILTS